MVHIYHKYKYKYHIYITGWLFPLPHSNKSCMGLYYLQIHYISFSKYFLWIILQKNSSSYTHKKRKVSETSFLNSTKIWILNIPWRTFPNSLLPRCPFPHRSVQFSQSIPCQWKTNHLPLLEFLVAVCGHLLSFPSLAEERDTYKKK